MIMNNSKVKNITSTEAKDLIHENSDTIILDVRTKGEYLSGHIPGAKLASLNQLADDIDDFEEYRNKPIIIYCATGVRSKTAVNILLENGFSDIHHLYKGFSSWIFDIEK